MTRVGVVLGGGGVVGQAYHSAVLAVLQHDLGFDARAADMIVGTSAGSITGTLLRLGVSPEDLAAWTVKAPLSGDDAALRHLARAAAPPPLAPFNPLHLLRRPLRLPSPHLVQRALTRPLQFRPMAAGMTLLAPGRHDIVEQLAALRSSRFLIAPVLWGIRDARPSPFPHRSGMTLEPVPGDLVGSSGPTCARSSIG